MYDTLVNELRATLPPESRTPENWASFRVFGLPDSSDSPKYVVTIDIASMYEYVDHEVLRRELLIQSQDVLTVEATMQLLSEAFGFARGLPQMMTSSDLLADVYLGILERALLRQGHPVARYADDFKVLVADWATANQVIEHAAEVARGIGLILSSEKTSINKTAKMADDEIVLQAIFDKYFALAQLDLTTFDDLMDWYGEPTPVAELPDDQSAAEEAFRRVLGDWTKRGRRSKLPNRLVAKSLWSLQRAPGRLSDKILTQLVFLEPLKLSSVILYLRERSDEPPAHWRSVSKLVAMERQSPWAKLWLLNFIATLPYDDSSKHARRSQRWTENQLIDDHEVVRAEAAWALARWGALTQAGLERLFSSATSITRPGLAAAWGRTGARPDHDLARAIVGSSPLVRYAFEWGADQHAAASESAR